ncbi:Polygalacturonase 3 [Mycena indigotica]|uniref:Polygalacturonase 3 n=1 Tax=Mycena indigotica TaxID=2126181 RepID=A0A8H6W9C0_9AGAR|nr:Polygalacturonase 3 [Mycena indigotica]KAF7309557.1 Polygalacturonase 3 [Mycena indigotica]
MLLPTIALSLPSEIWLQVAQHLPPTEVGNMYPLNSQWFEIAMNARYQHTSFAFLGRPMLRILTRLRDPAVAQRVRTLHIHPYFVKEVEEQTGILITTHCRRKFKIGGFLRLGRCARTPLSIQELVPMMVEVVSGLPNLTAFNIAWNGLETIHDLPVPILVAAFRPSLLRLTVEISLEKTVKLLAHTARLENLEELDLFIRLDHLYSDEAYKQILVSHVAPAINRLHKTLQKLSLRLCEPMDVAPLFDSLQVLPFLESVAISIPLARPHLGDPSGLGNFFERQRNTLRNVALRSSDLSGDGLVSHDGPLSEWVNDALSFVAGPTHLRSLDISLTLFPLEAAALCLGLFARSLTSLTLTGRQLTYDSVDELLGAVRRGRELQKLRLGTVTLSPELIDLIAEKLPALERLDLTIHEVVGSEGELLYLEHKGDQIQSFLSEMEQRRYPEWSLHKLALSWTSFPFQVPYASIFAECIPSLLRV